MNTEPCYDGEKRMITGGQHQKKIENNMEKNGGRYVPPYEVHRESEPEQLSSTEGVSSNPIVRRHQLNRRA